MRTLVLELIMHKKRKVYRSLHCSQSPNSGESRIHSLEKVKKSKRKLETNGKLRKRILEPPNFVGPGVETKKRTKRKSRVVNDNVRVFEVGKLDAVENRCRRYVLYPL